MRTYQELFKKTYFSHRKFRMKPKRFKKKLAKYPERYMSVGELIARESALYGRAYCTIVNHAQPTRIKGED